MITNINIQENKIQIGNNYLGYPNALSGRSDPHEVNTALFEHFLHN